MVVLTSPARVQGEKEKVFQSRWVTFQVMPRNHLPHSLTLGVMSGAGAGVEEESCG